MRALDVVDRLLRRRGVGRHAYFLVQQEGTELPGGVEAVSGFVLDAHGRVHGFWLGWDPRRRRHALDPWYPVPDPSTFQDDPEYRRARAALGLRDGA
jgi:hypothetical protein